MAAVGTVLGVVFVEDFVGDSEHPAVAKAVYGVAPVGTVKTVALPLQIAALQHNGTRGGSAEVVPNYNRHSWDLSFL